MGKNAYAIVLAAGTASRFGSAKQLAPVGGEPMAVRAIKSAAGACGERTILVLGYESNALAAASRGLPGFIVINDQFADGIGTSIAAAIKRMPPSADAALVTLADQPLVTAEHLRALIDSWSGEANEIVATGFAGTRGPPVLFPRGCFESLAGLRGDMGARHLFRDKRFFVTTVAFEPAAIDVDTNEDLRQI